jgi:wyosine [tRNA(Phe)-imidazoG37] synthetase (radical SAM superfamily)
VQPAPSRVYGPVPSRRLGRSLGVDLVPFKTCPYNCVYCQLGPTTRHTAERSLHFPVEAIVVEVLERASASRPNVITLAGSGEPTLFAGLGDLIDGIKAGSDVPVALLTNGALFRDPELRREAALADFVLPSLDAGDEAFFQWVNRPVAGLTLDEVTDGLVRFRDAYRGRIWLEVMILQGYTELPQQLHAIAARARRIKPDAIQLNTPVRPAVFDFVRPVPEERLASFCNLFEPIAEVIAEEQGTIGNAPFAHADAERIVALLSRRPCTLDDVCTGLGTVAPGTLKVLEALVREGRVGERLRDGRVFYQVKRYPGSRAVRSAAP